jgi:hypothetical protein
VTLLDPAQGRGYAKAAKNSRRQGNQSTWLWDGGEHKRAVQSGIERVVAEAAVGMSSLDEQP